MKVDLHDRVEVVGDTAWDDLQIALTHVIRDAIARGKTRFGFLRGEERSTYEFGPIPREVYQVRIA